MKVLKQLQHRFGALIALVPVPAAVWLFASALIGLFGSRLQFARGDS